MTRRGRHPWGISADQLSRALGHGHGHGDGDGGQRQDHGTNRSASTSVSTAGSTTRPGEGEGEGKGEGKGKGADNNAGDGEAQLLLRRVAAGKKKEMQQPREEVKEEIAACAATDGCGGDDEGGQQEFDFFAALPRPSAGAHVGGSPSSAERFSYGFDDSASEKDANIGSDDGNDHGGDEIESPGEHAEDIDDQEDGGSKSSNYSISGATEVARQAPETRQQQQIQEVPVVSSPSSPAPTQKATATPLQALAIDEQLALSLLARERKQLQRRRAQAKADERMAQEVQSQLDRLSFAESITSSVGDGEEVIKKKEERRRSIEADAEFATLLSSMEDANLQLMQRQRQQQEESDAALARAEQEWDRRCQQVKNSSASDGTGTGTGTGTPNADSAATASLSSAQQIQLDELLAKTEVARDEIRLELRNRAVEHDEEVARAEQARERAVRDVTDETMAQTLQEEHIREHWQQGQHHARPRSQDEHGHVHDDSLPSPPPSFPEQILPHQSHQTNSSSTISQLHSPPHASPSLQTRVSSVSELENQLLLSGCTVRDVTDTDEVRRNRDLSIRCAVCMEPFVLGDRVRTLPCLHVFHARCIDQWICLRGTCPIDQNPCL